MDECAGWTLSYTAQQAFKSMDVSEAEVRAALTRPTEVTDDPHDGDRMRYQRGRVTAVVVRKRRLVITLLRALREEGQAGVRPDPF